MNKKSIDNYIKCTHNLLENVEYKYVLKDYDKILEALSRRSRQSDIELISIYSSSLIPYILTDKLGQNFLIWDEHFWNIYDYYIEIVVKELKNRECKEKLRYKALALIQMVDANLFRKYPSLAKEFADNYIKMGAPYHLYANGFQKPQHTDLIYKLTIYSRMYVMFHELAHKDFKESCKAKENSMIILQKILQKLYDSDPLYMNIVYPTVKHLVESLMAVLKDDKSGMVEEFMCDWEACIMLIHTIFEAFGVSKENASLVMFIATSITKYVGVINRNTLIWEEWYKIWHQSNGTFEFIHNVNLDNWENINDEYNLRVDMLTLAFNWYCEKEYAISFLPRSISIVFEEMEFYMYNWFFVEDIISRERKNYLHFTPEENLQNCHTLLQWYKK